MKSIQSRIKEARKAKDLSITDVAMAVGVSPQAARLWEDEHGTLPRPERMSRLAQVLSVTNAWLLFGEETPLAGGIIEQGESDVSDTHRSIPMYDVELFLSNEKCNAKWLLMKNEDPILIPKNIVLQRKLNVNQLRALKIQGDSMSPSLDNSDIVIIDISDTHFIDGEIYAIIYNGVFGIKKLQQTEKGISIINVNPLYSSMCVKNEDIQILGRKVYRCG